MRRYKLDIRGREFSIDVQEVAADRFEVAVDGDTYEVTLAEDEDLPEATITPGYAPAPAAGGTGVATAGSAPPKSAVAAQPRSVPPTPTPARARPGAGSGALNAPMPGVILDVAVKPGDAVVRGQEIAVLDAMKMHNSIRSPRAGTIREVCVSAGQAVGHGDPIIRYEEG